MTSYCPPTPTQPLSSPERRAKYAHTYTHTCTCAHTSCYHGPGDSRAWTWLRSASRALPLTSPRIPTVGECSGQKQPLDRAWAHLISPGPEAGKNQRRGRRPRRQDGSEGRSIGMLCLQTPPHPLQSMRSLPSLYSRPSQSDRRKPDSSPSWEPLLGKITLVQSTG